MVLTPQFEYQLHIHSAMDEHEQPQEQDQDEIFAQNHSGSPEDAFFDEVVSALQDIMLDQQFQQIQADFMRKHCWQFQPSEENKPEYMLVFNLYQQQIEHFVQHQLKLKLPNFEMQRFVGLLESRTEQIDEQILDMIESFSEFESFKKIMVEYREFLQNEERLRGLTIKSSKMA